jgi:hypothetical protein
MKINLSRPLVSYLTREIEKGDITRALLWTNEYREHDPHLVNALHAFAKRTDRVNKIKPDLQQQLLDGHVIAQLDTPLPQMVRSTGRRPRAPSFATLKQRLARKSIPLGATF